MTDIELGVNYNPEELTDLGYKPDKTVRSEQHSLVERFGQNATRYIRGSERCVVLVGNDGLCKVVGYFNSIQGKKTRRRLHIN
ncbi:MAG: hypothetical protein AABX76_02285 [Nanoarchaeota archaeon]